MEATQALGAFDLLIAIAVLPVQTREILRLQDLCNLCLIERPRVHVGVKAHLINGTEKECLTRLPRFAGCQPGISTSSEGVVGRISLEGLYGLIKFGIECSQILIGGEHYRIDVLLHNGIECCIIIDILTEVGFQGVLDEVAQIRAGIHGCSSLLRVDVATEGLGDGVNGISRMFDGRLGLTVEVGTLGCEDSRQGVGADASVARAVIGVAD